MRVKSYGRARGHVVYKPIFDENGTASDRRLTQTFEAGVVPPPEEPQDDDQEGD